MSRTINKVILVGNVGRDPDVFETKSGTKVVHLSLATNRPPFGDDDEQRTDWHRLTLWAGLAQFTEENVKKGDRIYVEGRLEYDWSWPLAVDGFGLEIKRRWRASFRS